METQRRNAHELCAAGILARSGRKLLGWKGNAINDRRRVLRMLTILFGADAVRKIIPSGQRFWWRIIWLERSGNTILSPVKLQSNWISTLASGLAKCVRHLER